MSATYQPGERVRVLLDGGKPGTVKPESHGSTLFVDVDGVGEICIPDTWVERVPEPCPWTETGTPITWEQDGQRWFGLLTNLGWFRYGVNGMELIPVYWAADIAPYQPKRLVPEKPARRPVRDDYEDTWYPIEGTDMYARAFDLMPLQRLEDNSPVTEVSS